MSCPECGSDSIGKHGRDQLGRQRYKCKSCNKSFGESQKDALVIGVTGERMQKVLGQDQSVDKGPTEDRLREWLDKDVKGYTAEMKKMLAGERTMEALQAEVDKLKAELAASRPGGGPDRGSAKSRELLEGLFSSFGAPWTPSR